MSPETRTFVSSTTRIAAYLDAAALRPNSGVNFPYSNEAPCGFQMSAKKRQTAPRKARYPFLNYKRVRIALNCYLCVSPERTQCFWQLKSAIFDFRRRSSHAESITYNA